MPDHNLYIVGRYFTGGEFEFVEDTTIQINKDKFIEPSYDLNSVDTNERSYVIKPYLFSLEEAVRARDLLNQFKGAEETEYTSSGPIDKGPDFSIIMGVVYVSTSLGAYIEDRKNGVL